MLPSLAQLAPVDLDFVSKDRYNSHLQSSMNIYPDWMGYKYYNASAQFVRRPEIKIVQSGFSSNWTIYVELKVGPVVMLFKSDLWETYEVLRRSSDNEFDDITSDAVLLSQVEEKTEWNGGEGATPAPGSLEWLTLSSVLKQRLRKLTRAPPVGFELPDSKVTRKLNALNLAPRIGRAIVVCVLNRLRVRVLSLEFAHLL